MMNLAWNISVNSYFLKPDMQLPVKKTILQLIYQITVLKRRKNYL